MRKKTRCFDDDPDILRKIRFFTDLLVIDVNNAAVRLQEAADALHQDGLAGTVIAYDPVDFAFFKGVGNVLENMFFPEIFIDAAYFNDVFHNSRPHLIACTS